MHWRIDTLQNAAPRSGRAADVPGTIGAAVVFSVVLALGVVYQPYLVAILVGVTILGACTLTSPKATLGLILVASLFGNSIGEHVSSAKLIDDGAILVYSVLVLLTTWRSRRKVLGFAGGGWFLLFLALGAIASLVYAPLLLAGQDAYLFAKGALLAWAVAQLNWQLTDVRYVFRFGLLTSLLIFFLVLLNILMPGIWYPIFAHSGTASRRFAGVMSLIGPFVHPGVLGQIMALVSSFFLAYAAAFRRWRWPLLGSIAAAAVVVFTFRRKALVGVVGACAALILARSRRRILVSGVMVLLIVIVLAAAWPLASNMVTSTYREYFGQTTTAPRIALYEASAHVAYDNFPLGAGFARFGGWIASANYSPLYAQYGIDKIPGMGPGSAYLTDTFWPAILGQTGIMGLIAYALFLIQVLRMAKRLSGASDPRLLFLGLLGCAWWAEFLIESIGSAAYSSPPGYLLFFSLVGISSAMARLVPETATGMSTSARFGKAVASVVRRDRA